MKHRKTENRLGKLPNTFHVIPSILIVWSDVNPSVDNFAIELHWLRWAIGIRIYK